MIQGIPLPDFAPDEEFLPSSNLKASFPIISSSQLATYLLHPDQNAYDAIVLGDSRFDYEYGGGFINGATNILKREDIISLYDKWKSKNVLVIFYCDAFKTRSMHIAAILHNYDCKKNSPHSIFRHIFILNDGYENFYHLYPQLCSQNGCVRMRDDFYIRTGAFKKANSNFVSEILYRGKLPRCCSVKFSCPNLTSP